MSKNDKSVESQIFQILEYYNKGLLTKPEVAGKALKACSLDEDVQNFWKCLPLWVQNDLIVYFISGSDKLEYIHKRSQNEINQELRLKVWLIDEGVIQKRQLPKPH